MRFLRSCGRGLVIGFLAAIYARTSALGIIERLEASNQPFNPARMQIRSNSPPYLPSTTMTFAADFVAHRCGVHDDAESCEMRRSCWEISERQQPFRP